MADNDAESPTASSRSIAVAPAANPAPEQDAHQDYGDQLQSLISLERERIDSANRKSDVIRFAIEANDASDRRQFDFRMANLEVGDRERVRRFGMARTVVYSGGVAALGAVSLLFYMTFFGDDRQSETAVKFLIAVGTAVGGYGAIEFGRRMVARLLRE